MSRPAKPSASTAADRGRPLLVEVSIPVALGLLVLVASLGLVAVVTARADGPVRYAAFPVAMLLTGGLGWWIAWILRDTALGPLEGVKKGLRGLEEGDYDAKIEPGGAREFRDLAQSFNRAVTFLGHQRENLKQLASTDPTTGLANHRKLFERLPAELDRMQRDGGSVAVVALDLDGFRQVNEERGHARGDEVLAAAGAALKSATREGDLVARLGSDDFMMLLADADQGYARELVDRAREAIARTMPTDIKLTASAGFVCCPGDVPADADLVQLANAALRVAKEEGGSRTQKYDTDSVGVAPTQRAERQEIEELLALAEPVVPVYQPIVDLRTGQLVGYEALARFPNQPDRTPDAFFNQAARVGLGTQLECVAVAAALRAKNRPPGTYLSLNLTPSAISSALVRASLPQDLGDVVIELTEHELAPDSDELEQGLADLRGRGAKIAIDDAGAGYAGLQQVMRVQPDIIKLDRSLVSGVDNDHARAALIEFFVVFARRIGAEVCCEGIETPKELVALSALGVKLGQGYLLGRPGSPWSPISEQAAMAFGQMRQVRADAVARPAGAVNRRVARPAAARR